MEMQQKLEDHGVQLFFNLFEIAPAAVKLFKFDTTSEGKVIDDAVRWHIAGFTGLQMLQLCVTCINTYSAAVLVSCTAGIGVSHRHKVHLQ